MCSGARLGVARAAATAWVTDLLFCRASRRPSICSRSYSSRPSGVRAGAGNPYRCSHRRSVSALTLSTVAASLIVSVAQPSFKGVSAAGSIPLALSGIADDCRIGAARRRTSGSRTPRNGLRRDPTRTRGLTNGQATRLGAALAELGSNFVCVPGQGREPGAVCGAGRSSSRARRPAGGAARGRA